MPRASQVLLTAHASLSIPTLPRSAYSAYSLVLLVARFLTAASSFLSSPATATGASSFSAFACAIVGAEALTVVFLTCNASQRVQTKVLDAELKFRAKHWR